MGELVKKEEVENKQIFDSKKVVRTLETLMERVTKESCTPETVNAACHCAGKITEILRLHLDLAKLKGRPRI